MSRIRHAGMCRYCLTAFSQFGVNFCICSSPLFHIFYLNFCLFKYIIIFQLVQQIYQVTSECNYLTTIYYEPKPSLDIYIFLFCVFFNFPSDQRAFIPAFDVQSLLPKDLGRYYRYNGSLTTPPCYQSVVWTVFHERVQISKAQVWLKTMSNTNSANSY